MIRPGRGKVLGAGSGNGIDIARFADDQLPTRTDAREQFGLPLDAPVIGFVGRFTKDKGIEDLIEAFTTLPSLATPEHMGAQGHHSFTRTGGDDGGADPWLLLVGQFEDGDPVDDATRRTIETHERIVVVPWLDHPGAAYRATDLLAFPSYREGLPNVPLEAQMCGVPVVGYAATGTVDAVADADGGTLVPVGDSVALRVAIRRVLTDSEQRRRFVEAAPSRVRVAFDRASHWSTLVDTYRQSLAS